MKRNFVIFLSLISISFGQGSISDLNRLSNNQLDLIKDKLQLQNEESSDADLELQVDSTADATNSKKINIVQDKNEQESEFFGYNYFEREINFFDNTPTPPNFRLGPGDEIILSLWGESNLRVRFILNKQGSIFYENIGFINLSNKTINEAELLLKSEFSKIYSTLNDEKKSTKLLLETGKIGSMNIYFSGEIKNPGIHIIHPFSDIFTALIQSGGVSESGSLRSVKLIRDNAVISTIDFYSFFMDGKNEFSNIKLIDGDVIHIPQVKKRASISGEINREKKYELLDGDSYLDLINFAGGLTSYASSYISVDQVKPLSDRISDDNAFSSLNLNLSNAASFIVNNGDVVYVNSIGNVDSKVEVFGRVKNPGKYSAINSSLKNILDIAGGFDDPIFRKTIRDNEIIILRKDDEQFYSKELIISYKNADKFQLEPNDKIFIYEDINYRNSLTYRVEGEVNKPGTYIFKEGVSVEDAILNAQGLTTLSSYNNVIVFQEYTELDENENEVSKDLNVASAERDFIISPNTVIKALPFENVVRVEGNVYNPGLVAYKKNLTMYNAIVEAGGYKPYSMKKRVYVRSANGEVRKSNFFRGRAKRLTAGDTIVVPVDPNPSDFDITTFVADLSTTLANIAAILLIVDNQANN